MNSNTLSEAQSRLLTKMRSGFNVNIQKYSEKMSRGFRMSFEDLKSPGHEYEVGKVDYYSLFTLFQRGLVTFRARGVDNLDGTYEAVPESDSHAWELDDFVFPQEASRKCENAFAMLCCLLSGEWAVYVDFGAVDRCCRMYSMGINPKYLDYGGIITKWEDRITSWSREWHGDAQIVNTFVRAKGTESIVGARMYDRPQPVSVVPDDIVRLANQLMIDLEIKAQRAWVPEDRSVHVNSSRQRPDAETRIAMADKNGWGSVMLALCEDEDEFEPGTIETDGTDGTEDTASE